MDARQHRMLDLIMTTMLQASPEDRKSIWDAVTYNDIFCVHCGYGEIKTPNTNCQCTNDE